MKKLVSIGFLAVVVTFNFQLSTFNSYAAEKLSEAKSASGGGLVAQWKFDEKSGDIAADAAGGHEGEIRDAEREKGLSGFALMFIGQEKTSVVVPDADDLNPPSQITIEVWFKTDITEGDKQLVNKISSGKQGYRMTVDGGKVRWQIPSEEKEWSFGLTSSVLYPLNEWVYAAGTYDGKMMRIYINGKEAGVMERTGEIIPSESGLIIGNFGAGHPTAGFTGLIDEVRIYNRALTPDEIQKHAKESGVKEVAVTPAAPTKKAAEVKPGAFSWEFKEDEEGWTALMGLKDMEVKKGILRAVSTNNDPAFGISDLTIEAKKFPFIILKVKFSKDSKAQIFWATEEVPKINEPASIRFDIPGDDEFHEIKLNVGENQLWKGNVTQLRFDPCSETDVTIEIDYIRFAEK